MNLIKEKPLNLGMGRERSTFSEKKNESFGKWKKILIGWKEKDHPEIVLTTS